MSQQCPLLFRQVDATVTRINTLFVMIGIIGFLLLQNFSILAVLIIDFMLRLYGYKHLSPINTISLMIQHKLSLPTKMEDAGAKRLAAFFGVGFIFAIAITAWLGLTFLVNVIAAIYLVCATLDLFFGYCIACKIYHLAKKVYPKGFE